MIFNDIKAKKFTENGGWFLKICIDCVRSLQQIYFKGNDGGAMMEGQ